MNSILEITVNKVKAEMTAFEGGLSRPFFSR